MKKLKKIISISLLSFSLLTLPKIRVQADTLPKLEITNRDFNIVYTAKQFKNRSMILALKNDSRWFVFLRDNFEYPLTEQYHAMTTPTLVIGNDTNTVFIKCPSRDGATDYLLFDKTNIWGDVQYINDEINNYYVSKVEKCYTNATVEGISSFRNDIEWVKFKCNDNGKNTIVFLNKNGTMIDTRKAALGDEPDSYFEAKAIDCNGNILSSKSINNEEYIIKINTDGSAEKFNLNKDLLASKDAQIKEGNIIATVDDMIEDKNHNIIAIVNESDKHYDNYNRYIGVFKIEGSKINLIKKSPIPVENFTFGENRILKDGNNDIWAITGDTNGKYLNKLSSSYDLQPKYELSKEVYGVDVYDENNIIVSGPRGYGTVRSEAKPVNFDDMIYKSAYDATINAINKRDQLSINDSRKEILNLWWINEAFGGEFSKKVDEVQQGLFQNFIGVLFDKNGHQKAYSAVSQDELNSGRKLVNSFATYRGNRPYIPSWSSALDEFQQYKISLANNLVENAEKLKTKESKDKASEAVNELLKVQENSTVLNFAKDLEKRVNLIVDAK